MACNHSRPGLKYQCEDPSCARAVRGPISIKDNLHLNQMCVSLTWMCWSHRINQVKKRTFNTLPLGGLEPEEGKGKMIIGYFDWAL